MKKVSAVIILLAMTLVTLMGCADRRPSDYAGTVDTSGVVLPEILSLGSRIPEEKNSVLCVAALRGGPATVSETFSLAAAVKTSAEVAEENRAEEEAYRRLIASSAFRGEPADQDLYIYRYNYKLSEEAKAAGMEKKTRSSGTRKKKKKAEQNADSEGQLSLFSL